MSAALRRFVLFFLLAWFPVQSLALPALSTLCQQHEAQGAEAADGPVVHPHSHAGHEGHHAAGMNSHVAGHSAHADAPPTHPSAESAAASAHAQVPGGDHPCCDHHFTGVLFTSLTLPDSSAPAQVAALPFSPMLFAPVQPDHPPSF